MNETEVSFFENIKSVKNGRRISITQLLEDIKNGRWKDETIRIRGIEDGDKRREEKSKIPCVTPSGVFPYRNAKSLTSHSGLICIDMDKIKNIEEIKDKLKKDPFSYAVFNSVSGTGLAAFVKIDPEKHLESFLGLEKYYLDNYGYKIDESCKDVSRARFVSYDPDLFTNPNSEVFEDYITEKVGTSNPESNIKSKEETIAEVEYVVQKVLDKKIILGNDSYDDWLRIGFALVEGLGEAGREYFHRVSSVSQKYNQGECDKQYDYCLNGNEPIEKITIKTFFYFAKEAGITDHSVRIAVGTERTVADKDIIPESAFPFEIFPERLRNLIDRFGVALHVQPEMVGSSMVPIIGGAIGNAVSISPKPKWEEPSSVWLNVISETGFGKSPVINTLIDPVSKMQGEAYKEYRREYSEYKRELEEYKSLSKEEKKLAEFPQKPQPKHFMVSDFTIEALVDVFGSTPRGVTMHRDELSGLIFGLNQYKGKGNDRQHMLELFNAKPWKVDRKTTGSRFVPNTCASIIGGMTPGVMSKVFDLESFDDGFLPRFLLLLSGDKPPKFSREEIRESDLSYWEDLLKWCYRIPLIQDDNDFVKPTILTLSAEALDIFEAFYNKYVGVAPYVSSRIRVFIPKLITYCLRFTLILHVLESFSEKEEITKLVNAKTIINAIKLTSFFGGQAVKAVELYGGVEEEFNEYQKRLIRTLYSLKDEVKHAKLSLSRIVELFNRDLHEKLKHTPEGVKSLLNELKRMTKKGTGHYSELIWENGKINNLFSKITVPTSPTVTNDDMTEGTRGTVGTEGEVNRIKENEGDLYLHEKQFVEETASSKDDTKSLCKRCGKPGGRYCLGLVNPEEENPDKQYGWGMFCLECEPY